MSKKRKDILPGANCWDAFFDTKVQSVLRVRFEVPMWQEPMSLSVRQEFLAWPIIAFWSASIAEISRTHVHRNWDFMEAYVEDRQFVADLLAAITRFHKTPECEQTLPRRVAEASNRLSGKCSPSDSLMEGRGDLELMDWKGIAELLNCKNSAGQLKVEFHRERKRRLALVRKWQAHLDAYHELKRERGVGKLPWLPLQHISLEP